MENKNESVLDNMHCSKCGNAVLIDGKIYCKKRPAPPKAGELPYEIVGADSSCSFWEDNFTKIKTLLKMNYQNIQEVTRYYCDLREDYYDIISLWVMGTWFHDEFNSYPFLFFNAMRGSGKTRLLRLISLMSKGGGIMASPTEATLFRLKGTLCIDEFEGVISKDKNNIRELLNTAYKKGIKIQRMKEKNINGQKEMVVEEFEPYRPIALANINGMEEVLGDRCITLTLEKSEDRSKTMLIEDFSQNKKLHQINTVFSQLYTTGCSSVLSACSLGLEIVYRWNDYIKQKYTTGCTSQSNYTSTESTYNTYTTTTTLNTLNTYTPREIELFNKIDQAHIYGRNLELFFPLFSIASIMGDDYLDKIIVTAKKIVNERQIEEIMESTDVSLYQFVAGIDDIFYKKISELTDHFKLYMNYDHDSHWLNPKWMGRALKRLNLIHHKRRISEGVEVLLNVEKAKQKSEFFKNAINE